MSQRRHTDVPAARVRRGKIPFVSPLNTSIPVSRRVGTFSYAIRNIVAEAERVEAAGRKVRYLNIVEAVVRAMRDGENGYSPSPGVASAREAVAAEYSARGWSMSPDRVLMTAGTSEGIDLALSALVDDGSEVLVPLPTYPLYTAVLAKLGGRPVYYRTDPARGWEPDLDSLSSAVSPATRALVVIDPNNPTGAAYSTATRRALIDFAERHGLPILADEVYGDLGYAGPVAPLGSLDREAPIISFGSLSKGYLAPGWRAGWLAAGASPRLSDVLAAMRKLADGRLCSTVPMQHAVTAALRGDRTFQHTLRAAFEERARITAEAFAAMPGASCVPPRAAFYAMPKIDLPAGRTDEEYVLGLLRTTGILCVYGSGFGLTPGDGYLRVVFLSPPDELREIYRLMAEFTADFVH
jgi:alanine-synthesizing transaminase